MNMKFRNLKYAMYGLASLLFVNCTEEDNKVKVPEYTKFENPEWIVAAGPVPATAPTDWTVEFTGGVNMPEWQKLAATPAERPTWTVPDMHIYPASMTAIIRMSDYIQPSISSADLLGAFIGEECRGIASYRNGIYLIQIKGDPSEMRNVEFRYYCDATKELFISADKIAFESDITLGTVDNPKTLTWDSQSDLPYYMDLNVDVDLSSFDQGAVTADDIIAAFVGDECRGVGNALEKNGKYTFSFRTWAKDKNEKLTLKYYTSALKDTYVYGEKIEFRHTEEKNITMSLNEQGYMDMYVSLPEVLLPYVSDNDNLAAFVNDYPCSIIQDKLNGQYLIKMKGSNGDKVSFRYYCDKLKYIFTTENCASYTDASSWGSATDYQVLPLKTDYKLVNMQAVFMVESYKAINTELTEGDLIAAFINEECRGVATGKMYEGNLIFEMDILGTLGVNEQFTLKYYHLENQYMFTCARAFDFEVGSKLGNKDVPQGITLKVIE